MIYVAVADLIPGLHRRTQLRATIEQIAREAGVSAPTVFKYFGSKQEILLEMLQKADEGALEDARVHMAEMDDPLERLAAVSPLIRRPEDPSDA